MLNTYDVNRGAACELDFDVTSVSDMLDELGWPPLSQRRQEA